MAMARLGVEDTTLNGIFAINGAVDLVDARTAEGESLPACQTAPTGGTPSPQLASGGDYCLGAEQKTTASHPAGPKADIPEPAVSSADTAGRALLRAPAGNAASVRNAAAAGSAAGRNGEVENVRHQARAGWTGGEPSPQREAAHRSPPASGPIERRTVTSVSSREQQGQARFQKAADSSLQPNQRQAVPWGDISTHDEWDDVPFPDDLPDDFEITQFGTERRGQLDHRYGEAQRTGQQPDRRHGSGGVQTDGLPASGRGNGAAPGWRKRTVADYGVSGGVAEVRPDPRSRSNGGRMSGLGRSCATRREMDSPRSDPRPQRETKPKKEPWGWPIPGTQEDYTRRAVEAEAEWPEPPHNRQPVAVTDDELLYWAYKVSISVDTYARNHSSDNAWAMIWTTHTMAEIVMARRMGWPEKISLDSLCDIADSFRAKPMTLRRKGKA